MRATTRGGGGGFFSGAFFGAGAGALGAGGFGSGSGAGGSGGGGASITGMGTSSGSGGGARPGWTRKIAASRAAWAAPLTSAGVRRRRLASRRPVSAMRSRARDAARLLAQDDQHHPTVLLPAFAALVVRGRRIRTVADG